MTDYLMDDNDDGYLGLGLDDPAPPTPPEVAMPTAPAGQGGGDYLGGDGGYLDGGYDAPAAGSSGGSYLDSGADPYASQSGGGYLDGGDPGYDTPPAPQPMPAPAAPPQQQYASPAMAHAPQANPQMQGELSVQAPYLEDVHPGINPLGGARPTLSSLVLDVEVPVEVYFGDAKLTVEEFLEMGPGSVIELDHAIDAPIELRVRGKLIAEGQLVTINGNYGMRIVKMLAEHGA